MKLDQQLSIERDEILKWLSPLDFEDKQRDVFKKYQKNTGQWLVKKPEFQEWFRGNSPSLLWCPGYPGAGKTVMTSMVVNHIDENSGGEKMGIAYIYCDKINAMSADDLFFCIIKQLAKQTSRLPLELKSFYDVFAKKRRNSNENERMQLLRSICLSFRTTYLCVDGLDECPEAEDCRARFIGFIRRMESFIWIFITSRSHLNLRAEFSDLRQVTIEASSLDLAVYLQYQIRTNKRLRGFINKDVLLEDQIIKTVSEKANGI